MKTFSQFLTDAEWSLHNLWLEGKGFKNISDNRKKSKRKKKEAITKWEKKVQKLQKSGGTHWSGLEEVE
jgi:hypothetical protein